MKSYSFIMLAAVFVFIFIGDKIQAKEVKPRRLIEPMDMEKLKELRKMINADSLTKEYMKMDTYLLRWLRSKHFNLDAAKEKFEQAIKWRAENDIDSILNNDKSNEIMKVPFYTIDGTSDKNDRPIVRLKIKKLDTRKFALSGQTKLFEDIIIQMLEKSEEEIYKISKFNSTQNDGKAFVLADLSGFNLRQHACVACVPLYTGLVTSMENYYPGLYKLVLINSPRIFTPVLEIVKSFMSKATRESLFVYGPDRQEWQPKLLQMISADQLPIKFGGTMKTK